MSFNLKRNLRLENNGVYIMMGAAFVIMSIAGWYINKGFVQYASHDATVITICEMVKPEALVDSSVCEK